MFPADRLVAVGGALSAYKHDDTVYWAARLDFAPLDYKGRTWTCAMASEWLTFPASDPAGATIEFPYTDEGPESSFYVHQHDTANWTRLSLGPREDDHITLSMEMEVDFTGTDGTDSNPALRVRGTALVPVTDLAGA